MTKHTFVILAFSLSLFLSCSSQSQNEEGARAISEIKEEIKELLIYTPSFDADSESYWAYNTADTILNNIDTVNFEFSQAISDIYNAYSHVFYGLSYTKTIYYQSDRVRRGLPSSLSEHSSTICKEELNNQSDFIVLVL